MRLCLAALVFFFAACGNDSDLMKNGETVATPALVRGIDLSHHNGPVDWDALGTDDVGFLYLKATEGRDWKDPRFQENWREATVRGYDVGAYHFYLLCKSGAAQADNFIQSVEVRRGALPPAIDLEYAGNCEPNGSRDGARGEIETFLEKLEAEYGAAPVIYTTESFYADWISGHFTDHPIWLRKLGDDPPRLADGRDWLIWQYAANGRVAGIDGPVDLNRMRRPAD